MNGESDLAKKLWKRSSELMWQIFLALHDDVSVAELIMDQWKIDPRLSVAIENDALKQQIVVQVRETGKLEVELIPNYIRAAMKMMYSSGIGRATTHSISGILSKMTERQGRTYSNPNSKAEIPKFIEFHHLNEDEMLEPKESFANFNEFFYRKLKPSARPVAKPDDSSVAVSAADCRLNVFPTLQEAQELWIKGDKFTLETLLRDPALAQEFAECSLVISRLAPQDYHRYHCPVTGKLGEFNLIEGAYYTVNPIAINQKIDVYGSNKRLVTSIETEDFGKVLLVAVGATMVGSINMTVKPGASIPLSPAICFD